MTPTCPYCRAPFDPDDEAVTCVACDTTHHADCLRDNGGCTVFGCSEAPVEEAKVSISDREISLPLAPAPPPPPRHTPVPPPPRRPGSTPPPPHSSGFAAASTSFVPRPPSLVFSGYAAAPDMSRHGARRNRVAFVMLAIFFGALGVHNFYAGYIKKAVIQCCITVLTLFFASPVIWVWAIIEACMIDRDDDGALFT